MPLNYENGIRGRLNVIPNYDASTHITREGHPHIATYQTNVKLVNLRQRNTKQTHIKKGQTKDLFILSGKKILQLKAVQHG